MRKKVKPDWRPILRQEATAALGDEFMLLEKPVYLDAFANPFKADATTAIICRRGTMSGAINLRPFSVAAPNLFVVLAGEILEYGQFSEDFDGLFIIMSNTFTDALMPSVLERLPLFLFVQEHPAHLLNEQGLHAMENYYNMIKRALQEQANPHRREVVRHLTLAFCYGAGFYFHPLPDVPIKTNRETLLQHFLDLVQRHYKEERGLEFYADILCITSKHLSRVIKETSGTSPNDWIDSYVILEAKALLNSTGMTVQQVSDSLDFSSQSFFGKYFKRKVGISPSDYRRGKA